MASIFDDPFFYSAISVCMVGVPSKAAYSGAPMLHADSLPPLLLAVASYRFPFLAFAGNQFVFLITRCLHISRE
jgi:hypothetical protein